MKTDLLSSGCKADQVHPCSSKRGIVVIFVVVFSSFFGIRKKKNDEK